MVTWLKPPRRTRLHASILGAGAVLATGLPSCSDPFGINSAKVSSSQTGSDDGGAGPNAQDLSGTFNEDCPAGDDWIPADGGPPPPVRMFTPPPHPDTECPFYRGAYQNFLIVAHPDANGDPDLVHYATIDDTFTTAYPTGFTRNTGDLAPDGITPLPPSRSPDPYVNPGGAVAAAKARQGPPTGKAWLGAVRQAGQRNVLIDQDHHTLYYGLHMNQAFVDFVRENGLTTSQAILNVGNDPNLQNLQFPPGVVEFKTAWKDIDPRDFPDKNGAYGTPNGVVPRPNNVYSSDPGDYSNYITTMAWIPWLTQDATTGRIVEDPDHPVLRKMALVAIHCVYTYPGHPEFVWGSIQHVNVAEVDPAPLAFAGVSILGAPDSQPDTQGPGGTPALPTPDDPQNAKVTVPLLPAGQYMLLHQGGTPENQGNGAINDGDLKFDEATQSFPGQQTTIYRMFPGSKSNVLSPDTAVFSLNSNLNALFANAIASKAIDPSVDKRQHYRLVAAVWMDKPALFGLGADGKGMLLQNDDTSPLVVAAKNKDPMPDVSQGVTCGTPLNGSGLSGDAPGVTAYQNSVPGCVTRADLLDLPNAPSPQLLPDGGPNPENPSQDYANYTQGTDLPFSILGGEDRLSSTAMESFTQNGQFHNCFACHNTQPITTNGTPSSLASTVQTVIPYAAKINVSHMFSEFVLREQEAQQRQAARSGM